MNQPNRSAHQNRLNIDNCEQCNGNSASRHWPEKTKIMKLLETEESVDVDYEEMRRFMSKIENLNKLEVLDKVKQREIVMAAKQQLLTMGQNITFMYCLDKIIQELPKKRTCSISNYECLLAIKQYYEDKLM
ncbi:Hypothetical protein CINCED_3A014518 [Cinara cedri]|uniref:Uncharacterized protein n=1 Tax=Cinara cedri TaxID=506608 RepID=A0A5E4M6R8_9HEMI|nr:Hypothetical protein CINCED_3A014518 [Cinara cedri]